MPFLIPFLIVNVISCGDDFVEDTGGGSIPPEEIIIPPVYMLLDGPYKSGVVLTRNEDDSYIIETIDGDPWVTGGRFKEDIPEECNVLEFEYQTMLGISNLELFFADAKTNIDASHSMSAGEVPSAETWKSFSVRLKQYRKDFDWGEMGDYLRIDLGNVPDNTIQIRNICLRVMNEEERKEEEEENNEVLNKEKYEQNIKDYLNKDYNCHVTDIAVGKETISVRGNYQGDGVFFLGEIPPFVDMFKAEKIESIYKTVLSQNSFEIHLDRYVAIGGYQYDRLLSKWAIFKGGVEKDEQVSHARYVGADGVYVKQKVGAISLKSKKGLGGAYKS